MPAIDQQPGDIIVLQRGRVVFVVEELREAVAVVAAARGHHVGDERPAGMPLVQVALDRRELAAEVSLRVLALEAVYEVLELGAVPLEAHALRGVQPVAGRLPAVLVEAYERAPDLAYVVRADVPPPRVVHVQLAADHPLVRGRVAHLPRDRVLHRAVQDVRLAVDRRLHQVRRRGLPEAREQRPQRCALDALEDLLGNLVGALVYPAVLALDPCGERPQHVVYGPELARAEEGALHEPHAVLHGALALRVGLAAHPERDVLLVQEGPEGGGLEDLAVDLLRHEHAVLVDHVGADAPAALAAEAVERPARLLRAEPVVLRVHAEQARVPQQHAHEVHDEAAPAVLLPEVDLGHPAGLGDVDDVVAPARVGPLLDPALLAQAADVVAQRLLVAGKGVHLAGLHEALHEHVVDRAHVAARVPLQYLDDRRRERLDVERGLLPHPRVAVLRDAVHVVVLAHRLERRNLVVARPEGVVGLADGVARELQLLYLLDHPVLYHLVAPSGRSLVGHDR